MKKEKKPDNETSESNWEFKDFSGYEEPLKKEKVRLYMTFKRLFQENWLNSEKVKERYKKKETFFLTESVLILKKLVLGTCKES